MAHQARRAAGGAALASRRGVGKAVAAEAWLTANLSRQIALPIAAERAPGLADVGRIDAGAGGEGDQETLVAEHMLQHSGEKAGFARGVANARPAMPVNGKEAAEPVGSSAMKASA